MKIFHLLLISFLVFVAISQETTPTCTDDQVLVKGKCKDVQNCKTQLGFFKQTQANGKKQIAKRPTFALELKDGNLQFSLTFANGKDLQTSVETGSTTTCIQINLRRFGAAFTNEVADASVITSTSTDTSRTWSFTVNKDQFDSIFLKDESNDEIKYTGFYAISVTLLLPNDNGIKPLAFFAFKFSAIFSKDLATLKSSEIKPKVQAEQVCADAAGEQCVNTAQSTLTLCSDDACETPLNTNELVKGETIYLKQSITQEGFKGGKWKPMDAEITVVANGVTKSVKPKKLDKGQNGEQMYQLKLNFLGNKVTIGCEAQMGETTAARILQEAADDPSVVGSTSVSCIKETSSSTCPTEEQVLTYNSENCSGVSCDDDESSNAMIFKVVITMLGLLIL
ncbi:unnamed protein product [Paramecium pentaurelia]|uniref:Uncharacterized protein n=1 Tax=Paramecium pentaurelia TaxID=43138 RepID=A0A8S1SEX2_9CILI|nr:unnamed protein product [Paramecium pentaurelia]